MKINQYCSVCKTHLDMEVVPTDDAGDDGVIWLCCPQCRGFLPKFSGESQPPAPAVPEVHPPVETDNDGDNLDLDLDRETEAPPAPAKPKVSAPPSEPIAEYAAALAAADSSQARPYRPTEAYEPGEVIHHLAWDDCGLVIAKESLPGNRRAIKVYFGTAGVVHLIEQSSGGG